MRISDWSSDVLLFRSHPARRTAEDSILMLEPDDIRAAVVDLLCGCEIIGDFVLPDHPRHLRRIVAPLAQVLHRIAVDVNRRKTLDEAVTGAGSAGGDPEFAPRSTEGR